MFNRWPRFLLFSALLASAGVTLHCALVRRAQAEQAQPFGLYSAQQIAARAEPIGRALTSDTDRLHLSTNKLLTHEKDGRVRRHWIVECTDRTGNDVAQFDWDADTGELYVAGHRSPWPYPTNSPLKQREAIYAAWNWLQALGVAEEEARWRLAEAPRRVGYAWLISWQAKGRAAAVMLDIYSGHFTQVRSWRLPTVARSL